MLLQRLSVFLIVGASVLCSAVPRADLPHRSNDEHAAHATIERWLKAQNDSDFTAYQALYATRFTGIRRSGPRIVHLDRKSWIADRQRMFRNKMNVTLADLVVVSTPGLARVRFTQTWESGTYKDAGPKELLLVREDGGLKIGREELLASKQHLAVRQAKDVAAPSVDFAFVLGERVVIDIRAADAWARGAPKIIDDSDPMMVVRKVDEKKLPPELAAWRGSKLRVFSSRGAECTATVTGFEMVIRVVPHFGTKEAWASLDEAARAQAAWQLGNPLLVGTLENNPCHGVWARATALPSPIIVPAVKANPALRAAGLSAIHKEKEYLEILAAYRKDTESKDQGHPGAHTWEQAEPSTVRVLTMTGSEGGRPVTWVSVTLDAGIGCGAFEGRLWALYENVSIPGEPPKLKLRTIGEPIEPQAAVDLDGDGQWELLFESGTGSWHDKEPLVPGILRKGISETLHVDFRDCPC